MAPRTLLLVLLLFFLSTLSAALYEDQVGLADWSISFGNFRSNFILTKGETVVVNQYRDRYLKKYTNLTEGHKKYIGKVKQAVFHTQKTGRKRVVVSTEENFGDMFLEKTTVDQVDIALAKYAITLSSEGSMLRAWNLPDGQMIWETMLQVSKPTKPLLLVLTSMNVGKDNLIVVSNGGGLHAISSIDGKIIWSSKHLFDSLDVQQIFQSSESDIIRVVGFVSSLEFATYHVNTRNGELMLQSKVSYPSGFYGEASVISANMLVALDASRDALVLIKSEGSVLNFHKVFIADLVPNFLGMVEILPSKISGVLVIKGQAYTLLVRVKSVNELEVIEKVMHPSSISDSLALPEHQYFAIVHHDGAKIHFKVKHDNDLTNEFLKETVQMDIQRGNVEKVFINNYIRTDRSHGFRALLVMEDHSLLLIQQGEIVWNREDGLASIIGLTSSELPVEKEGVSVAEVEHNIFEWLKGHILKLKGTLMLASPDEIAAIQAMRLKSSEKNKMTRDHNGFRKLVIVLTRPGKVFALHIGDGHVIWSLFVPSLRQSGSCKNPSSLGIYNWHDLHHHAMDENPSVLVVGRCGHAFDASGIFSVIDSYTGKEQNSLMLTHSVSQVIPLPFTDSSDERLHLVIDSISCAHLYPRNRDSLDIFLGRRPNIYWYSVDAAENIIRGYALERKCHLDIADDYCFEAKELWSIVFPAESEKIAVTTTRKMNEVVHTQAKAIADKDVMYKYISTNIIFVATVSPKASREMGCATPEEAWLVGYLIDAVSGRILHRVTHQGAQGPIHAILSENWLIYHYFNLRAHRYEISVIEIYDQSRADNKDVWKLIMGDHNLTSPISSYSRPEVMVKSQSYFFTHSVKTIDVTTTAKGITSKQLLIGTIGDQILALDKRYLDPRRSANPTQAEKDEGIIPLTDSLPLIPQSYVMHSLQVEGLRGIVTIPAKLESTTLLFSYGLDLFFTRIAPSRTYDSLTEDFSYALLLITIVALVAAIFVTWVLSEQKELKEKWK